MSTEGHIGKAALQSHGEWELRGTGFDPGFVSTQLRQDLESNSEEVQVIEDLILPLVWGRRTRRNKKSGT